MDKIKIYMSRPSLADIPDDAIIRFNDTDVVTGSAGYNAWWSKNMKERRMIYNKIAFQADPFHMIWCSKIVLLCWRR